MNCSRLHPIVVAPIESTIAQTLRGRFLRFRNAATPGLVTSALPLNVYSFTKRFPSFSTSIAELFRLGTGNPARPNGVSGVCGSHLKTCGLPKIIQIDGGDDASPRAAPSCVLARCASPVFCVYGAPAQFHISSNSGWDA